MVRDDQEGVGVGGAELLEALGEGFTGDRERLAGARGRGEDRRRADERDLGGFVDEGAADHVLVREGGQDGRGGHVRPHGSARSRVERVDEGGERRVAGLAELRRVLDLFQGHDAGAEPVDAGHDLRLLPLEAHVVRRAAGPEPVHVLTAMWLPARSL
ncbi:hypothetical protein GCM10027610_133990 [Dactylosporangium cerinum]